MLCIACVVVLSSCTPRSLRRIQEISGSFREHEFEETIENIHEYRDLYGRISRFLYWFDLGVVYHYSGRYDSSITMLEKAEQIADELYTRSVTNEAASLLSNDNIRPYRPRRYEAVLTHLFNALNYQALRKPDEALVEVRKLQVLFDNWKSGSRKGIEDNGMARYLGSILYDDAELRDDAVLSLFEASAAYKEMKSAVPEQVAKQTLCRLEAADRREDIKRLNLRDTTQPESCIHSSESEIVIVGYCGLGPVLGEKDFWGTYIVDGALLLHYKDSEGKVVTIRMSAPELPEADREKEEGEKTKSGTTFHIKASFPEMETRDSETTGFKAYVGTRDAGESVVLERTEEMLERELSDNFQRTLARTALRVVLRTIGSQKLKKEMRTDNGFLNLVLNLGTDIATDQMEHADTRLCFLLPATYNIIRIPVEPGSHKVRVQPLYNGVEKTEGARIWESVEVDPGEKRFLFWYSFR